MHSRHNNKSLKDKNMSQTLRNLYILAAQSQAGKSRLITALLEKHLSTDDHNNAIQESIYNTILQP